MDCGLLKERERKREGESGSGIEMDINGSKKAARVGGIEVRQEMETGRGIREVCVFLCTYKEKNE